MSSITKLPWADILEEMNNIIMFSPTDHMAIYLKAIASYQLGDLSMCSTSLESAEKIQKGNHIDMIKRILSNVKVELKPIGENVREAWFQGPGTVSLTLYAKNVKKDHCIVIFDSQHVSVKMTLPDGSSFNKTWKLFEPIIVNESFYELTQYKLEINLQKLSSAYWKSLVEDEKLVRDPKPNPKDWDLINNKSKLEDDDEEHKINPLEYEFKNAYASGNDDVKRAMMKSYVESGGKALSFDWADVSKRNYHIQNSSSI